jgi:hypothetical protein
VISANKHSVTLLPGQFCLIPACLERVQLQTQNGSGFLLVEPGEA